MFHESREQSAKSARCLVRGHGTCIRYVEALFVGAVSTCTGHVGETAPLTARSAHTPGPKKVDGTNTTQMKCKDCHKVILSEQRYVLLM